jgi:hypothetical protein
LLHAIPTVDELASTLRELAAAGTPLPTPRKIQETYGVDTATAFKALRLAQPKQPNKTTRATGEDLLAEVRQALKTYLVLPSAHAEVAVTLWITATHAAPALHHFPRLAIRSPEKRCGKTRLLDIIADLGRCTLSTANISSAVLYRVMGGDDPRTLIIDEADTIWGTKKQAEQNEDLRGLVNAGFERGRPTLRYDIKTRDVEELETFGFVALAGIGALPDTITDRSINVVMRRRMAGESVSPYRSKRDGTKLHRLRDRLHDWIAEQLPKIDSMEPVMPVEDRAADVWEALVIVADLAGGSWPQLARDAAVAMTQEQGEDDSETSDSLKLLQDIRDVLTVPFMPSKDLVNALRHVEDAPWTEYDLSTHKLGARLRHYKIKPRSNGNSRGYRRDDFADAFNRYLTDETPDTSDALTLQSVKVSTSTPPLSSQSDTLTLADTSEAGNVVEEIL